MNALSRPYMPRKPMNHAPDFMSRGLCLGGDLNVGKIKNCMCTTDGRAPMLA